MFKTIKLCAVKTSANMRHISNYNKNRKIKCVITSGEGTLFGYGGFHGVDTMNRVCAGRDIAMTRDDILGGLGLGDRQHLAHITRNESFNTQWRALYKREFSLYDMNIMYADYAMQQFDQVGTNLIAPKYIYKYLKSCGIKIGLSTCHLQYLHEFIAPQLTGQGWTPDYTVTARDAALPSDQYGKVVARPFGTMIDLIRKRAGVDHSEVLYVGDTIYDAMDGYAANVKTALVTDTGAYMGLTEDELNRLKRTDEDGYNNRLVKNVYNRFGAMDMHYSHSVNNISETSIFVNEVWKNTFVIPSMNFLDQLINRIENEK
ncbi:MAG: phosphonoacetaldehyde hydrolase [Faunusvirus sp.]|jgi:phosphoglycolate phosphatase-like HAD superfamily hydrolase|uniref:Phosphonoacetaldehyde hydrolase n=1 Tax=Faunusvirus sp. TaxID=2487766 RepID=A0A3G4ZYS2_9VIRU|nr:MAG: phosphonoacetaldehyde hydrolase [Faunusvirus sp.]